LRFIWPHALAMDTSGFKKETDKERTTTTTTTAADEKKSVTISQYMGSKSFYVILNEPAMPAKCLASAGWQTVFEFYILSKKFFLYDDERDQFVSFQQLFCESSLSPPPQATHLVKRNILRYKYQIGLTQEYESAVKNSDAPRAQSWHSSSATITRFPSSERDLLTRLVQNAPLTYPDEEPLVAAVLAKKIDGLQAYPVHVAGMETPDYYYGAVAQDETAIELLGGPLEKRPATL